MNWKNGLLVALTLTTALAANEALACSPVPTQDYRIAEFATPDRIAYTANGWSSEDLVIVTDDEGSEYAGEVQLYDDLVSTRLFVPDEPLAEGVYTVTIENPITEEVVSSSVEVAEPATPEVSFDLTAEEVETWTDSVCCSTEPHGCTDSCGTCVSCWPSDYEYVPRAHIAFRSNQALMVTATVAHASEDTVVRRRWLTTSSSQDFALRLREPSDDAVCVEVSAETLDGTPVFTEERCVDADDVERLERRTPDASEEVAACAEPPDDTDDPNWRRYSGGESMPTVGCTTSGDRSGWPALLLVVFVLLAKRSRRRGLL